MNITDELRTSGVCRIATDRNYFTEEELTAIADASVLLPVDVDGEIIHIGDVMEWPSTGETFEVVGIGDGVLFYVEDGNEQADWTGASTKRHHHDTWERIIEDATAPGAQMGRRTTQVDDLVARCKALADDRKGQ